jgi:hypothetical protein
MREWGWWSPWIDCNLVDYNKKSIFVSQLCCFHFSLWLPVDLGVLVLHKQYREHPILVLLGLSSLWAFFLLHGVTRSANQSPVAFSCASQIWWYFGSPFSVLLRCAGTRCPRRVFLVRCRFRLKVRAFSPHLRVVCICAILIFWFCAATKTAPCGAFPRSIWVGRESDRAVPRSILQSVIFLSASLSSTLFLVRVSGR